MTEINKTRQARDFGFLVGGAIAFLFGLVGPLLKHRHLPVWPWATGMVLVLLAALAPRALAPVYRVWMRIGEILGKINSRIVLSLAFFGMFVPVGFFMRLFGSDPMRRSFDPSAKSYRVNRQGDKDQYLTRMDRPY